MVRSGDDPDLVGDEPTVSSLRKIAAPFVADPATGVCIRTRLKDLTDTDVRSTWRSVSMTV